MKAKIYAFFLGMLAMIGILIAAIIWDRHPSVYGVLERETKRTWTKVFGPSKDENAFAICEIQIMAEIPHGSVLIVGHARSDLEADASFPGPKLTKLLVGNPNLFSHVVFTGDVFAEPSRRKWQAFKSFLNDSQVPFLIAPGNHEHTYGDNAYRDIFDEQIGKMHLRTLVLPDAVLVLEDSTRSKWLISDEVIGRISELRSQYPTRHMVLLRHNIPVSEMLGLANSKIDMADELPPARDVARRMGDDELTIIAGDSGAFRNLPRSSCHRYKRLTFLSNGLGGFEKDAVLILYEGQIWIHQL